MSLNKYLIWDFDGTLAFREGKWSGCLRDAILEQAPDSPITIEQIRPHLQTGFPWNNHEQKNPHVVSADQWWASLHPLFEQAFIAVGVEAEQAQAMAKTIRHRYLDPQNWALFDDTVDTLEELAADGWRHIVLSNHVPELRSIIQQLGIEHYFIAVHNSGVTGYEKPHR